MTGVTAPRKIPANLTNRDCPHPPRGVTKAQFQVYVPLIAPKGGGGGGGGGGGWGTVVSIDWCIYTFTIFMQIYVRDSNNL